jgi:calcium-dependent protein kinase
MGAKLSFEEKEWKGVSDQAKDIVSKMLERDPAVRCSSEEALNHAWFKMNSDEKVDVDLDMILHRIKAFRAP